MGMQNYCSEGNVPQVALGLGVGAELGNPIIQAFFARYKALHSFDEKVRLVCGTIVDITTQVLRENFGLQSMNEIQKLDNISIYPKDYFCPLDDNTGVLKISENTRSIHWYSKNWIEKPMWYFKITRLIHRFFGINALARFR